MALGPQSPGENVSSMAHGRPSQSVPVPESPAAQHLAALNKKEVKKEGKSSRLRRAFSFGSAAELRKASAENNAAKLRKNIPSGEQQDAEEAAIVQKQEAAGLGASIYSGQGNFFTGSTDNLSISSTASSASVMLRKMGTGVKKGTRSFVGLFRPKSVIGVPAADGPITTLASTAQVSMVTIEAERERVNVNVDPHDRSGGGTGFPKLGRNSMDAASTGTKEPSLSSSDMSADGNRPRRSIVGGDKDRAEVLAAVKKGILKRAQVSSLSAVVPADTPIIGGPGSGASSPSQRTARQSDYNAPQFPGLGSESPQSSAPSTPNDDQMTAKGHRRTDSVTIEGEDYFLSLARYSENKPNSMPATPVGSRNISFSPRIIFHDTFPPSEYDRRGEIATCNRLTPMLAQQIKEELNSFKMVSGHRLHAETNVS